MNECMHDIDTDYRLNPSVEQLIMLLLGDDAAMEESSDTWYELLVARLLFKKPHMMKDEIPGEVNLCVHIKHGDQKSNGEHKGYNRDVAPMAWEPLDELRRLIMEMDVIPALRRCDQLIDLRWFSAHLADLLHHAGQVGITTY
jgi:predicted sugar kinase